MEYLQLFITASTDKEADIITDALMEKKLVACVNRVPQVLSTYWWRGKRETATEVFLMAKSRKDLLDSIIAAIKEVHSYEVPEIVALPVIGGNKEYLRWIDQSLDEGKE
ncbi:MAG: cytochrome C biogenesis protein CcdA [Elusimicrobia bacterium RIFOXYB2_FULL_49_7]|nr:MAG: cytochrome C biogenesis protein CcdA [Elusimicrobia bacterium RIFOXYB2_FULL_49_7]